MSKRISTVTNGSPAYRAGIHAGDCLLSINGNTVQDVLDYRFLSCDSILDARLMRGETIIAARVCKDEDEDPGLTFESGLMDDTRSCENNCIFCFIAQNAPGMRDTLYVRDDDWRLSFLTGNYITMTNMTRSDLRRLCEYHLSPINISVHAVTPGIRTKLMRNKRAGSLMGMLHSLMRAGISMNFQIVLCKGINDGNELMNSVKTLAELIPYAQSLSVVPVGLTCHRDGLFPLEPFSKEDALAVVEQIHGLAKEYRRKHGTAFVWAADEFYLKAGLHIPAYDTYEGFPQLENGVGMTSLFISECEEEIALHSEHTTDSALSGDIYVVTGKAAEQFISDIIDRINLKYKGHIKTIAVTNCFYGDTITVSGLLTGQDILRALSDIVKPGARVYIPQNTLRSGENVFLDNMKVSELEQSLNASVVPVPVNGADFIRTIINDA